MWVFLSRRIRQFVLLTVVLPLAVAGIRNLRQRLERRGGPSRTTRVLGRFENIGPLAGRGSSR
jgi:hypothetical protein